MPNVSGATLADLKVNPGTQPPTVTLTVNYTLTFSAQDRRFAGGGVIWRERIDALGVDAAATPLPGTAFPVFNLNTLPGVADCDADQGHAVVRNRTHTVPRSALQEDPAAGDADEIRCRIRIVPEGLPLGIIGLTDIETILG